MSLQEAQIEEEPEEGRRKTEIRRFSKRGKNLDLPARIERRRKLIKSFDGSLAQSGEAAVVVRQRDDPSSSKLLNLNTSNYTFVFTLEQKLRLIF
jgi:hypothetical protein